jgi:hypothetical protein
MQRKGQVYHRESEEDDGNDEHHEHGVFKVLAQ